MQGVHITHTAEVIRQELHMKIKDSCYAFILIDASMISQQQIT
jgi:hypothetical protein